MRRKYIDWARAIAILVMVEAHTLDAWTRTSDRASHAFRNLTVLGGFAAPLFLWLAGVALVLSAERTLARGGTRNQAVHALVRRGLEIFILAFLFRLQAFIVSPGSYPVMLFKVDILNIMGPALVAAAMLWGVLSRPATRATVLGVAAAASAMATPLVRASAWVTALPIWARWYLRPDADYTTFTLLPWSGFVFAGAATGVVLAAARDAAVEKRTQIALGVAGAALVTLGFVTAAQPSIYPDSSFWTSSPTFFVIRLGVLMTMLPALYGVERLMSRRGLTLPRVEKLGRSSLFVYWIHVELVYGYTTWPLRRHLRLWQLALAYTLFVTALYGLVLLRDRLVAARNADRPSPRPVAPAAA